MQRAIELSSVAVTSGKGLPIGCVIVRDGNIIGEGHNEIFARKNPTAHAEMVAIEAPCQNNQSILLENCELYTTLQPCPMCFGAIYWAAISKVYYAVSSAEAVSTGFDDAYIYHQLFKPPAEQLIPMEHITSASAMDVLQHWKENHFSDIAGRNTTRS